MDRVKALEEYAKTIEGQFEEVENRFEITSEQIFTNQTVNAKGYVSASTHALTPPDSEDEWQALAIAGWAFNYQDIRFSSCYINGNESVWAGLHSDSDFTRDVNCIIYILWTRVF